MVKTEEISNALIKLLIDKQDIEKISILNNHHSMIVIVNINTGAYTDTNKKTQAICKKTNSELKKMTIYDTAKKGSHNEIDIFLKYARKYKKVLPFRKTNYSDIDSKSSSFEFNIEGIVFEDSILLWQVC